MYKYIHPVLTYIHTCIRGKINSSRVLTRVFISFFLIWRHCVVVLLELR